MAGEYERFFVTRSVRTHLTSPRNVQTPAKYCDALSEDSR